MILTLRDDTRVESCLPPELFQAGGSSSSSKLISEDHVKHWANAWEPDLVRLIVGHHVVGDQDVKEVVKDEGAVIKAAFALSPSALVHLVTRFNMKSTPSREILGIILPLTDQIDDAEVTVQLVNALGARIDPSDLVLEPGLGTGSAHATLAVLELYRTKQTALGTVERAFTTVVQAARGMRFEEQHSWNEHQMAIHAIRKAIVRKVQEGSYDATDDIPEAAFYEKSEAWQFEKFVTVDKVPPGMCSLMVLSLLEPDEESARLFFEQTFSRSEPLRNALCKGLVPIEFLNEIRTRDEPKARHLILQMLANFEEQPQEKLIRLLLVLLGPEGQAAKHVGNEEVAPDLPLLTDVMRYAVKEESVMLRQCGERLFSNIFVANNGFVGEWTEHCTSVNRKDIEGLPVDILRNAVKTEDSLQLVRKAVLEHLEKNQNHTVERLIEVWDYCHWPLCQDERLTKRAIDFLAQLSSTRNDEQHLLFPLFTKLQFWRLPAQVFMTPYIPAQLLTAHVVSMYRKLVEEVSVLQRSHISNMAEINTLRRTLSEVTSRLEQTDARSQRSLQKLQN